MKKVHPGRILYDLKSIKGYFNCVPKDIAPDKDKGIYFDKAMNFLDGLIQEAENRLQDYRAKLKAGLTSEERALVDFGK